jgi:hypothetical protein
MILRQYALPNCQSFLKHFDTFCEAAELTESARDIIHGVTCSISM